MLQKDKEYQAACAAEEIGLFLRKWHVPVRDYKEKYGTVRVYCNLGWYNLHDVFYPGYAYSQFPKWLWGFDVYHGHKVLKYTGLNWLSVRYHMFLYRYAYKKAIVKYPEIRDNILNSADWNELLKGL